MENNYTSAVVLNGSFEGDEYINTIHNLFIKEINKSGGNVKDFVLHETDIAPCNGCFGCWIRTPGKCVIIDDAGKIAESVIRSDALILLTPVTFGGYSSELKKAIDRIICLISPFFMKRNGIVTHKPRYNRFPDIIAIGVLDHTDHEDENSIMVFKKIVAHNAFHFNSPAPTVKVFLRGEEKDEIRDTIQKLFSRERVE